VDVDDEDTAAEEEAEDDLFVLTVEVAADGSMSISVPN